jgi:hypothetical protein
MDARVVDDPGEALDEVSLVVTATTSHEPVLPDDVPEGVFIAAVGAFNPEMAELTPDLVVSSSVVVDTIEGVREKAGDLMQATVTATSLTSVRPSPGACRTPDCIARKTVADGSCSTWTAFPSASCARMYSTLCSDIS